MFGERVDLGFFTTGIRQKRIRGGSTFAECNSGSLNFEATQCYWRDPAIVSLPRLARHDTIDQALLAKQYTLCALISTAAGIQTGRGPGRSKEGWRVGGRKQGDNGGGREGSR